MKQVFLAIVLLFVAASLSNAQSRGIDGQAAPDWEVSKWHHLPEGKDSLELSEFEGKTVYLYCFQSWCPGCHSRGFPTLKGVSEHFKNDNEVVFVAVQTVFEGRSTNTFEKAKAVADKFELTIPFGHTEGADGERTPALMKNYRTGGTPWTIIIDPKGQVRFDDFHISKEKAVELINGIKAESDE